MNWFSRSRLALGPAEDAAGSRSSESEGAGVEGPTRNRRERAGAAGDEHAIVGDRGVSSLSGVRSLQSRVTNALAIGLMSALGLGLLGWYYAHTASRPSAAKHAAEAASQTKAEGDLPLPPLGKIDTPKPAIERVSGGRRLIYRRPAPKRTGRETVAVRRPFIQPRNHMRNRLRNSPSSGDWAARYRFRVRPVPSPRRARVSDPPPVGRPTPRSRRLQPAQTWEALRRRHRQRCRCRR